MYENQNGPLSWAGNLVYVDLCHCHKCSLFHILSSILAKKKDDLHLTYPQRMYNVLAIALPFRFPFREMWANLKKVKF